MYFVYILRTSKGTFYTGQTNNLARRLSEHKKHNKKSSKYMKSFKYFELYHKETYQTRSEAMKREAEIKRLTRRQKESLIKNI